VNRLQTKVDRLLRWFRLFTLLHTLALEDV
jgi:hypothetical protein